MGRWILMIYPEPEARDTIYLFPPTHVKTQNTFILASMNYFDSDMSKGTNTVVCFDWKTGIYIYVCGICRAQFYLYAAKFEQTIIHQNVHLRRESRSHVHVLLRL
jgi:hypothetical protein